MRFQNFLVERDTNKKFVTKEEADGFVNRWKSKLKSYGITWVEFSTHFILDRLNHSRNNPPIQVEELDYMLEGFLKKVGSQFKKDVENVKNHTQKKRGLNKDQIPDNELEFAITSKSNHVKFVFVLKQDRHKKGTAMVLPMTIIRKKNFKITKGEQVMIEGKSDKYCVKKGNVEQCFLTKAEADRHEKFIGGKVTRYTIPFNSTITNKYRSGWV